jgi:acid stress chaperone HdeB
MRAERGACMKIFPSVLVAGLVLWGSSAVAEEIDLSTWTCKKFQTASKEEVTLIMTWLGGYYKDEDDSPIINTDDFAANAKKLNQYCASHPNIGLIKATDKLFQGEEE